MTDVHWISVDSHVFSESVVMKAVYWLSGRYGVELRSYEGIAVGISHPTGHWTDEEVRTVENRLRRDLIDFRTRELIEAETRTIRELLVAKAFASGEERSSAPSAHTGL